MRVIYAILCNEIARTWKMMMGLMMGLQCFDDVTWYNYITS